MANPLQGRSQRALHLLASSYSPSFCLHLTNSYSFLRIWLHLNPGNLPYCLHSMGHRFSSWTASHQASPSDMGEMQDFTHSECSWGQTSGPPISSLSSCQWERTWECRLRKMRSLSYNRAVAQLVPWGTTTNRGIKGMRDDILKVVKPRGHPGRTNSGDIGSPNRDICDIYVRSLCRYTVALEPVAQQVTSVGSLGPTL